MVKGLYSAYTGMIHQQHRMDVLTNNLANADTTGFKKEGATSQSFDSILAYKIKDTSDGFYTSRRIGVNNPGVKIGEGYTDFSQGPLRTTGNTFDLALTDSGFFAVEFTNKAGETSIKYTRDGDFALTQDGRLVTRDGDSVLDENGSPIKIDPLDTAVINTQGEIIQNGRVVATIQVTDFEDYNYLERYGENYFQPIEGAEETQAQAQVYSGYLEAANMSVVTEMVNMIEVSRAYESNQKVITTYDGTLEIAANQLGKI
ncbi:flagellar basal-body rod protein FlgF [Lachnospiraceae bacterium 10-1]|nr:flagellar basal-body rod protein FlgF [Lachnospiraceae bacterium 10-1]